jgi:CheY-like chemotaxis protein
VKRILIADDSIVVRTTVRKLFEQAGWTVCAEAATGHEAISKAQKETPDIVVLDLSMPAMNGLTAGRILKEVLPRIPLILFTSFGEILGPEDLQNAGFSALIDKADADKLLRTAQLLVGAA